jgi:hypothetical protein
MSSPDLNRARLLCTERELALVSSAQSPEITTLTPKRLQAKVLRTRGLRDKFRDLAHQQRREARGTVSPRGKRSARGNARTVEKEELFDDVLKRFEARLAVLDPGRSVDATVVRAKGNRVASPKRAAPSKPTGLPKRTAMLRPVVAPRRAATKGSARAPRGATKKGADAARTARKQVKLQRSHIPRAKAPVVARNRRQQARRDASSR